MSDAAEAKARLRDRRVVLSVSIDDVVRWSRTASGGQNLALFASGPPDEGCMRWGLCDTGQAAP